MLGRTHGDINAFQISDQNRESRIAAFGNPTNDTFFRSLPFDNFPTCIVAVVEEVAIPATTGFPGQAVVEMITITAVAEVEVDEVAFGSALAAAPQPTNPVYSRLGTGTVLTMKAV